MKTGKLNAIILILLLATITLMVSNDAYYDGMTQNDLDFKMQKTGATLDEYKTFAGEQVLAERGYKIPELEQIVFINTTMQEDQGSEIS